MPTLYWGLTALRRTLPLTTLAVALAALYLYGLNGVGVLSSDEPRYSAIGFAMAHTHDFITPRLWGSPWFEKPALLYWLIAAGASLGLGPELAGRLPVALLSLAFVAAYFALLRREFCRSAAAVSTAALATSAAWLGFSSIAVTDIPLAVFFGLATILALPLIGGKSTSASRRLAAIGICLGLAALAKGFVPFALALPFFWFLRSYWRKWWIAVLWCLAVAAPWYIAVSLRNGTAFWDEFFIKHHLERLYSQSLQHVQPWYYYFPVLLASLFPWTPLLGLLHYRRKDWDRRRLFLATVVVFGFVFFSLSLNKLPGYLLPLLPALFALIGARFESMRVVELKRGWLMACAALAALIPLLAGIIPRALEGQRGLLHLIGHISRTEAFYVAVPIAVVLLARRTWAPIVLVISIVASGIYLKHAVDPVLDRSVSARGLWRSLDTERDKICDAGLHRNWEYGLAFYNHGPIPACSGRPGEIALKQQDNRPPVLERLTIPKK
ncbi:MAG TPA: phospholipid carrier-dependent glycosyltransferase [Bryobacteraceae bacterium]|jgi:4-amino-4-deoxy-L-arabinose transferase-like glycosyltransferase|nr:phospholipid carrier-dependent glycosyltransferase [Bryobacteraceae bacterium]